jgi:hypothetical protein
MARRRFYIPLDGHAHPLSLGSEPERLAIAELGIEFHAEPGDVLRVFRVYEHGQPVAESAAPGGALNGHGTAGG